MSLTLFGLIVMPVGLVLAGSIFQLPSEEPESEYLKTSSALSHRVRHQVRIASPNRLEVGSPSTFDAMRQIYQGIVPFCRRSP